MSSTCTDLLLNSTLEAFPYKGVGLGFHPACITNQSFYYKDSQHRNRFFVFFSIWGVNAFDWSSLRSQMYFFVLSAANLSLILTDGAFLSRALIS